MDDITLLRAIMLLGKKKQFETGTTSKAITLLNNYNKERDEELALGLAKLKAAEDGFGWSELSAYARKCKVGGVIDIFERARAAREKRG